MCDEFFARARFAIDENRDIRLRKPADCAKYFLHGRCFTDDFLRFFGNFGLARALLFARVFESPEGHRHGFVYIEWLGEIFECTAAVGGHSTIKIGMGSHDNYGQLGEARVDGRKQFKAADAWHANITNDCVGLHLFEPVKKIVAIVKRFGCQTAFV